MSDFDHLLDPSAEELDAEIAAAGTILEKWAQEEGVDLSSLPEEEVASLLSQIVPSLAQPEEEPITKEANMTEITTQDVHYELTKVAEAEGVDINALDRAEYAEAFDAMLEEMQAPGWAEKVAAEEEAMAKLAEAEVIGQVMGDAFLAKLAEAGIIDPEMDKEASKARAAWDAVKATAQKAGTKAKALGGKARDMESRGSDALGGAVSKTRLGAKMEGALKRRFQGGAVPLNRAEGDAAAAKARRVLGRAVAGTGATALVGTGAALGASGRNKQSLDEAFESDAVALASHILVENEKVAADSVEIEFSDFAKFAGDEYFAALEQRATELLEEHGWL